ATVDELIRAIHCCRSRVPSQDVSPQNVGPDHLGNVVIVCVLRLGLAHLLLVAALLALWFCFIRWLSLLLDDGTVWQLDFLNRTFGDAVPGNMRVGNSDGGQATPGCRIFEDAAGLSNNSGDLNIVSPGDFYLFSIIYDGLVLN